jgi:hypothetical protein
VRFQDRDLDRSQASTFSRASRTGREARIQAKQRVGSLVAASARQHPIAFPARLTPESVASRGDVHIKRSTKVTERSHVNFQFKTE